MELVLASSSPRRQELLRAARIAFTVQPANIPEEQSREELPQQFSERLAKEKAATVWSARGAQDTIVLAADTIVVVDEHVLGKPVDSADATRMLKMISGRTHQVITSVCLMGASGHDIRSEITRVRVNPVSDEEIAAYVASGEPMDKAGAYGIQGMFSRWIPEIAGDYSTVVGLPISLVYQMLREHKQL